MYRVTILQFFLIPYIRFYVINYIALPYNLGAQGARETRGHLEPCEPACLAVPCFSSKARGSHLILSLPGV